MPAPPKPDQLGLHGASNEPNPDILLQKETRSCVVFINIDNNVNSYFKIMHNLASRYQCELQILMH